MTNTDLLTFTPLHRTFGALRTGGSGDLTHPTPELAAAIKSAIAKYGVLVFRATGLDDDSHVALSRLLGELDDVTPYNKLGRINRLKYDELFDVSNIESDGSVVAVDSMRAVFGRGNQLFHVDSSFNPRRAGLSLLLAHELPPRGTGGNTEFADTRTAYADLDEETKKSIEGVVAMHSMHHSRRVANPGCKLLDEEKFLPTSHPFGKHKPAQLHEPSGRMNLYIAAHAYALTDRPVAEGQALINKLLAHATQPKYVMSVEWEQPGDLVIWDNTCVMHRACPGEYEGKFRRDMRRTTVHDSSSLAWGENVVGDTWRSGLP